MITLPDSAECRCLLADGRVLSVTATRRPRANRADVKCAVAGAPALCERMQEVVRLARHTETRLDSRDQVVLSMDLVPRPGERAWELAAVLADRMVRGEYQAAQAPPQLPTQLPTPLPTPLPIYAQGWSDAWHLGQVTGRPLPLALRPPQPSTLIVGGAPTGAAFGHLAGSLDPCLYLTHLGALSGHTDPSAGVSSARAWFPLHSGGINDSLGWVEVSVHPLERGDGDGGGEDNDAIAAPALDLSAQLAVRQALLGARHFDGRGLGRWRTVVRFGQNRFQGNSYELALVLADRLARGREFVPRGRLIASGCSGAWHAGRVDSVEGRAPKLALILAQALAGDRVLLPAAWRDGGDEFALGLRARGASVAWIERIGVI